MENFIILLFLAFLVILLKELSKPQKNYKKRQKANKKFYSTSTRKRKMIDTKIKSSWNIELLKAIEWKTFEKFCAEILRAARYHAFRTPSGKDDGIDIFAYQNGDFDNPAAIVQCKAWVTQKVGVNIVREFYGVMSSYNITKGIIFITGEFSEDAKKFAEKNKIILYDGKKIIKVINNSSDLMQNYLKKFLEMKNFAYPTCPKCNTKMILRESSKQKEKFWGCKNYPKCKQMFKLSKYQKKFVE